MGRVIFSITGGGQPVKIVQPTTDEREKDRDIVSLGDRIPILYSEGNRTAYLGNPGWLHQTVAQHHGLVYPGSGLEGYFNGNKNWGHGAVCWPMGQEPEVHQSVVDGLGELYPHLRGKLGVEHAAPDWENDSDLWAPLDDEDLHSES